MSILHRMASTFRRYFYSSILRIIKPLQEHTAQQAISSTKSQN